MPLFAPAIVLAPLVSGCTDRFEFRSLVSGSLFLVLLSRLAWADVRTSGGGTRAIGDARERAGGRGQRQEDQADEDLQRTRHRPSGWYAV